MENMGYRQKERLKDIVSKKGEEEEEKAAAVNEEEAKEQQQEDDERYDTVAKIKLVHHGKRVKIFRVTRNLNRPKTKMIMANITPHIEMRVKVIYSLESVIYRGGGGKKDMFTS